MTLIYCGKGHFSFFCYIKAYYQEAGEEYPIDIAYSVQSGANSKTIFLSVGNLTTPECPIRLMVAAYDTNGKMLSCSLVESEADFTPTIQASIELCRDDNPSLLKAFILNHETDSILRPVWETDIVEY